jgi:hypothetical protein
MHRKSNTDEDLLFDRARDFRAAGLLPRNSDAELEQNNNVTADCRLCGETIAEGSPHILLRWTDDANEVHTALLHPYCHGVWLVTAWSRRPPAE